MKPRRIVTLSIGALLIFLIYQPAVYYAVWWGVIVVVGDLFDLRFPPRPESASDEEAGGAQSKGYPNAVDAPWVNAIERRDRDEIQRLVASGADLEQPLFNGKTPALYAAGSDDWPIVLLLLRYGANPAATDLGGLSLATLAKTSRVTDESDDGRALAEVKAILQAKGLMTNSPSTSPEPPQDGSDAVRDDLPAP